MKYEVVFDVAQAGYRNWWFPACGLLFLGFCILIKFFAKQMAEKPFQFGEIVPTPNPTKPPSKSRLLPPICLTVFCLLWVVLAFTGTLTDYLNLREAIDSGRYEIVEGKVTDFTPGGEWRGHTTESFLVKGKRFEYSWYSVTAGFNQTEPHGGPVREGLWVRIAHVNGEIARLEIAQSDE